MSMAAASGTMIVVQNLLLLALISCVVAKGSRGRGLLAAPGETVFDVTKYGAEADGETDNYEQFMKAWVAACHSKTPARFLIPKGEFVVGAVVFQGPCSSSPIVVEVQGNVKAMSDFTEYPNAEWFAFEDIDGLHVMGHGSFNGQGKEVWQYNDCHKNKKCQMFPTSLKFTQVNNALVENIHTIDSMGFHVSAVKCNTFTFRNVTVTAPKTSPNTDGIHLSRCNDVTITDCVIGTGDDCISMVRGVNNVNISKITCGPGHGISVGSLGKYEDEEDVKNVFIKSCTLTETTNGIRIKTWQEGLPTKVVTMRVEDIVMNNVENPIIIDQGYCPTHTCKNKKPSNIAISDIQYKNIRGTSSSEVAVSINCSPKYPCKDISLIDINLTGGKITDKRDDDKKKGDKDSGGGKLSSECTNAKITYGGKQFPPPCH